MATVRLGKDEGLGWANETAWASGAGSNEKDATEHSLATEFTAFDRIVSFKLASSEWEQNPIDELGNTNVWVEADINAQKVLYEKGEAELHLQSDSTNSLVWLQTAFDSSDARGSAPNAASKSIRFDNGQVELEAFGNYMTDYTLSMKENDFVMQKLTFTHYLTVKSASSLSMEGKGFTDLDTYPPLVWRHVSTFTVESVDPRPKTIDLRVWLDILDEFERGTAYRFEPLIKRKNLSLDFTFRDAVTMNYLLGKKYANAEDIDVSLVLADPNGGTLATITLSNMRCDKVNAHESAEPGEFAEYSATLLPGEGFTATLT